MFKVFAFASILAIAVAAPAPGPKAKPEPEPSLVAAAYTAPIVAASAVAAPFAYSPYTSAYTAALASYPYIAPSVYSAGYPYTAPYIVL